MTDHTTPKTKKPGRPAQGPKYPEQISALVTTEMRAELDDLATETGATFGEVVRAVLSDGLDAARERAINP